MTANPAARPARSPAGYGRTAETLGELMQWEDVARRIAASPNYWLSTITPEGRPHLRPVDGVFVDSCLAFGGSPETRWVRHLQHRPAVSVSLPDDEHAGAFVDEAWTNGGGRIAVPCRRYEKHELTFEPR